MILKKTKIILFIYVSLLCLILNSYSIASEQTTNKTYNRILQSDPLSLDIAKLEDAGILHIFLQLAEGLVTIDKNKVAPAIAERWEISKDQKEYTFYLNKKARFSNGDKIIVDDIIASYKNLLRSDSFTWQELMIIDGAEEFYKGKHNKLIGLTKISNDILKIRLKKPFSPFLHIVANPPFIIFPKASIELMKKQSFNGLIVSGPYKIESYERGKYYLLSKNQFYLHADKVYYDKIEYTVQNNKQKAIEGFYSGMYDDIWMYYLDELPSSQIDKFVKLSAYSAFTWYLVPNLTKTGIKNIYLRKFIRENLDKDSFLKSQKLPSHYKSDQFIPRGLLGYKKESISNKLTEEKMKELLNKTNCTKNAPCNLKVIFEEKYNDAIQLLFRPLNKYSNIIKLDLVSMERSKWFDEYGNGNYDLSFLGNNPKYSDTYSLLRYILIKKYHPGIKLDKIQALLDKALQINDRSARGEVYYQVSQELNDQVAIIPIYHGYKPHLYVKKDVKGFYISVLGPFHLKIKDLKEDE